MADSVQKISKPQLRGLLNSQIKFHLPIAIVLSIVGGIAWKYGISDPRKRKYAEFYRTYDPEADFERMRKAGVFTSVSAD